MTVQDYTSELQYGKNDALFVHQKMEHKRHECWTAVSLRFFKPFLQPHAEDQCFGYPFSSNMQIYAPKKRQDANINGCLMQSDEGNNKYIACFWLEARYNMIKLAQQD